MSVLVISCLYPQLYGLQRVPWKFAFWPYVISFIFLYIIHRAVCISEKTNATSTTVLNVTAKHRNSSVN